MRLSASLFLAVTMSVVGAGCGSGGRSGAATTTTAPPATTAAATTTSGAGALQAEANATAAGDIPDNQVFLVFRDVPAGYSMKYPEGWAQQGSGNRVSFRDKNNVIRAVVSSGAAWTRASVQADLRALKGARVQSPPQAMTLSGPTGAFTRSVHKRNHTAARRLRNAARLSRYPRCPARRAPLIDSVPERRARRPRACR
jgi:hypothetical protein